MGAYTWHDQNASKKSKLIITGDFASEYPNSLIAFNISPITIKNIESETTKYVDLNQYMSENMIATHGKLSPKIVHFDQAKNGILK